VTESDASTESVPAKASGPAVVVVHRRGVTAWRGVERDLRRVIRSLENSNARGSVAPLHFRLGLVRLRVALLESAGAVVADLEAALAEDATERTPEEMVELAGECLEAELAGESVAQGVLRSLTLEARRDAEACIEEALAVDPGFIPALRASAALARAGERFAQAEALLSNLVEDPGNDGSRGADLERLGDIRWRHLKDPEGARELYVRARAAGVDAPALLDKILRVDLELENWREALDICTGLMESARDANAETLVTYMLTLGEVHLYGLNDPAVAMQHYLEAAGTLPSYDLTYTLLRELLEKYPFKSIANTFERPFKALPEDKRRGLVVVLDALRRAVSAHPTSVPQAIAAFKAELSGRADS
jgi:tetratricopeptide (TPR) repeat protein